MRLDRLVLLVAIIVGCSGTERDPRQTEVMEPVQDLFRAMANGDSGLARSVFHPDARLVRLPDRAEEFRVDPNTVDRFVAAIGGERDEVWEEPIWDWEVRIDGILAVVWTKYAFYRDGQLSHCGVDAFQLGETPAGWKIMSLVYSRRQENCEERAGR